MELGLRYGGWAGRVLVSCVPNGDPVGLGKRESGRDLPGARSPLAGRAALITMAIKMGRPPIRATACAWFFWTLRKSASSAGPCSLACLITSRVSSAEATKLTRKENIIILGVLRW